MIKISVVFCLFFAGALLLVLNAGEAKAEYLLRLPNLPEMRFQNVVLENVQTPLRLEKLEHWGRGDLPSPSDMWILQELGKIWSRILPKERVLIDLKIRSFDPDFRASFGEHKMIFYTADSGALAINGKEIVFPYSQIFIDKNHLHFVGPYRDCFRDITPQEWPLQESRIYASVGVTIRGVVDRLETDMPSLWEGRVGAARFMDVYLRDIEVLKIDCKPR